MAVAATRRLRPEVVGLSAMIAVLLPVAAALSVRYGSLVQMEKVLVPRPDDAALAGYIEAVSDGPVRSVRPFYVPAEEPVTGIARAVRAPAEGPARYAAIVVRYRITCQVCKDVLGVAVYDLETNRLARVFLPDPWVVRDHPVDTEAFLAQMADRPLDRPMHGDRRIDAISGATSSSRGLISRLDEAAAWLRGRRAAGALE